MDDDAFWPHQCSNHVYVTHKYNFKVFHQQIISCLLWWHPNIQQKLKGAFNTYPRNVSNFIRLQILLKFKKYEFLTIEILFFKLVVRK